MKKCMEKNSMANKEEVNLFCKNYYGYTMEEANKDIGYWMEKNYELKKENKELHNKIDKVIKIMEDYTLFSLSAEKVMKIINILKDSDVDE